MLHADGPAHVLMTADAVGGVWTYAVELCRQLDRRGIAVTLAVMGPLPTVEQRADLDGLPRVTLHARPFRLEWMEDPWAEVEAAGEWLLDLEGQVRPDIVHLNGYCHGALPWTAPCLVVAHSCVLSWWRAVKGEPAPSEWNRYAMEVARGLRSAAAVAAPSRTMLAWLEDFYGPLARSRVIANGRTAVESRHRKEPLILTVGRLWDEAKNVAAVCDAAAGVPWPVAIAGSLGDRSAAAAPAGVRYLGRLPAGEVAQWMGRASIYVLPARYEPFGLSVLEAALAGCALVLGDIPTLREIWGEAATYVPPEDPGALRAALTELVRSDSRRCRLAGEARERAAVMTPSRMADDYCSTYAELMHERRSLLSLGAV